MSVLTAEAAVLGKVLLGVLATISAAAPWLSPLRSPHPEPSPWTLRRKNTALVEGPGR